jgi:hypothetical protein
MKRWCLKPKYRGKRGGVTLSVPGALAGEPEKGEVSVTLYRDDVIEGDHWEMWEQFLTRIPNPVILRKVHAIVQPILEVVESLIPSKLDDIALEIAQPVIESAIAVAVEPKPEPKPEPAPSKGDGKHIERPKTQPIAPNKLNKLKKRSQ